MTDVLVVNASPLIFLGDAGLLDLLRGAAPRVAVPEAVWLEVTAGGPHEPLGHLLSASWIERLGPVEVGDDLKAWDLGPGESSVVAWATRLRDSGTAPSAVLDDLAGRRCARSMGLRVVGTLGLVIAGHRRGVVDDPRQTLEELRSRGMWLSDVVLERALRAAGLLR